MVGGENPEAVEERAAAASANGNEAETLLVCRAYQCAADDLGAGAAAQLAPLAESLQKSSAFTSWQTMLPTKQAAKRILCIAH